MEEKTLLGLGGGGACQSLCAECCEKEFGPDWKTKWDPNIVGSDNIIRDFLGNMFFPIYVYPVTAHEGPSGDCYGCGRYLTGTGYVDRDRWVFDEKERKWCEQKINS